MWNKYKINKQSDKVKPGEKRNSDNYNKFQESTIKFNKGIDCLQARYNHV